MRNLSQGDFINRISKLFGMASQKISELTKKSVDKYLKCRNGLFPIKNGF